MQVLALEDLLLIAEDLLGIPAEEIARTTDLGLADSALHAPFARFGGHDFYEGFALRAAILASRELSEQNFAMWVAEKLPVN